MPHVIDQAVHARLIATAPRSRRVPARLRYDSGDPFAVRVIFPPVASLDGIEVVWTFARDLLAAGLREPSGRGDVHIWPCGPEYTMLEFHTADGLAMVQFQARDLRGFLMRSYGVVPLGREGRYLDVEGDLAALLREA
ncbi:MULTISPECIES: spore wall synthesis regulator SsgD [Streptomyces]|uniref:SsgA family sporulation/cell division regulator n=2 Tax=Streptomyces rimosus subsp. rimosus TaxID=132474 RepID=L8EDH0_STRR1|nr:MULTISPECIES: SsgA family sporulation/cell division regulator [Streptomyces]KOG67439.1 regulator [Kitasatospora aureofaciens]MYT41233.1 SsgA family sporulation/cell division regulator [Streptomyces sp. SID5471]KEF09171.1 regulator [Streptomyces rimosus]KEF19192.1 regulator [Streptomyces rimosus]KOT28549.1 regulator [Streptomyces rimosus subsp. rimosus]